MAITGIPTFTNNELLTAAKLNSLGSAVTTKFNGGITQADLAWPFPVGGNIDMRFFSLLNVPRFWRMYNIADRDTGSGVTVQNVYDTVSSEGGGVVFVPPDTTVSMDAVNVPENVVTMGSGWTSVLAIVSSPSRTDMLRPADAAQNVMFVNLKLDGTASAGSNIGVLSRRNHRLRFIRVFFSNWGDSGVELGNAGVDGVATTDTQFEDCLWDNVGHTSQAHVRLVDVDGVVFSRCTFDVMHQGSIVCTPINNTRLVRDLKFDTCRWKATTSNTTQAFRFDKTSATLSDNQGGLQLVNCDFDGDGGNTFCAIDLQDWRDITMRGVTLHDCTSNVPAIRLRNCQAFSIDADIWDWTIGDGIVIGTQGYAETVFASRTDTPCFDFRVTARLHNIGRAGVIWTGGSQRWDIVNCRVSDCSQQTTAVFFGFEYWFTGSSTNTDGSAILGNSSRNLDAVAPVQAGGLETYSAGGNGGGATNTNVGGVGESNLRVADNDLPGMTGAGGDFAATGARHTFADNVV